MKKMTYETPVLEVRAYAEFENVFTACSRGMGMSGSGCESGLPEADGLAGWGRHHGS